MSTQKRAHKLNTGTWAQIKAGMKMMAFTNDSGIKGYLDKLEILVSQLVKVEISQIVQGVSYNAHQLDAVGKQLQYASGKIDLIAT